MANCEKLFDKVEANGYTVRLSKDEADFLVDIFHRIGGSPDRSRRKISDSLNRALRGAGARGTQGNDIERSIIFSDDKPKDHVRVDEDDIPF